MSPLTLCLAVLFGLWATAATFILILVANHLREQRRDRKHERAWFRSECERESLEALYRLPEFKSERSS